MYSLHVGPEGGMVAELPGFETFTKRMVPLGKNPYVTVQKRGLLSFNKAAHAALGAPEAVELLYNPQARLIAVRPVDVDVPHAYKFRSVGGQKNEGATLLVAATAFTNYYNIPTEVSVRRPVRIEDGVLYIDLKDEGTVVTSNRAATTSNSGDS
ncbi:hypothetical protein [Amnibacterium soli]